jgi:hypothetical protein
MITIAVSSNGGDTPEHAVFSQVSESLPDSERLIFNLSEE